MSELRWHPLLGEWVITATHRQNRTFFPPPDYNPLAPTRPGGFPTEIPAPDFDIVVFENKFPSLQAEPPAPAAEATPLSPVAPARGVCEVVVYAPDAHATLATLPVRKIEHLVEVWTDRYKELGALPFIQFVYIFENKGREIGVTLTHPHGQIYAYPFIPPRLQTELDACARHQQATGGANLLEAVRDQELANGQRIVLENDHFVAFVPFFARYPYETWVLPKGPRRSLADFALDEPCALAKLLKALLTKFDNLFGFSLPYVMAMHQAPTDGKDYGHYLWHIEFYPPHRTRDKLKYLAGSEAGAGAFINDTLAEDKADELRRCQPAGTRP
jgi:UDPglucose--hexose-1-phosphate uridylyltransferase